MAKQTDQPEPLEILKAEIAELRAAMQEKAMEIVSLTDRLRQQVDHMKSLLAQQWQESLDRKNLAKELREKASRSSERSFGSISERFS